jgi:hypothetical protein
MSLELSLAVRGLVTSVVHGDDFVASLSLGMVRDLRKVAYTMTEMDTVGSGKKGKVCDEIIRHSMYGDQYLNERLQWNSQVKVAASTANELQESAETDLDQKGETPTPSDDSTLKASSSCGGEDASKGGLGSLPSLVQTSSNTLASLDKQNEELWYWSIFSALKATSSCYEKLFPPGDVYWIHSDKISLPGACVSNSNVTESSASENNVKFDDSFYDKLDSLTQPTGQYDLVEPDLYSIQTQAGQAEWIKTRRVNLTYVEDVQAMFGITRFSPSMFLDHSPGRYEWCLKAAVRK